MCGRFTLQTRPATWSQELLPLWSEQDVSERATQLGDRARYNIAPTQNVACILAGEGGRRSWEMFRWGLIPPWADDAAIGNRMINARSETVHEKRSFKNAFAKRRCLIPADGYFEWMKTESGKQPYLIERDGDGILAMAGLWESNTKLGQDGQTLRSLTILTTEANHVTEAIHHRMPVMIEPKDRELWLDTGVNDLERLSPLFAALPDDALTLKPVSTVVNSPRNDSPECVAPADAEPPQPKQTDLF